jgi:hypothetical protein
MREFGDFGVKERQEWGEESTTHTPRSRIVPGTLNFRAPSLSQNAHPSMSHVSPAFAPVFGDEFGDFGVKERQEWGEESTTHTPRSTAATPGQ